MATWDEQKRRSNLAKHGVDLALAEHFDWNTAAIEPDRDVDREQRFRAIGFVGGKLYFLVITLSNLDEPHVISMRRTTPKERRKYAKEI